MSEDSDYEPSQDVESQIESIASRLVHRTGNHGPLDPQVLAYLSSQSDTQVFGWGESADSMPADDCEYATNIS
ncbi:unnamed protein product [Peniophora sp. CBMAI 1063]|nr:unnamed protein product [Peniophora sp. CBMAI 1063]